MGKCIEPVRRTPFKNHKSQNISVTYDLQLISYTSKFKTVPCLIAAKRCVSEVRLCFRNSHIPYLKVNSIFKKILEVWFSIYM